MKKFMDNIKMTLKKVWENYLECMNAYGDALMKGGSYGCA
jgi:hypothetical protein